MSSPLINLLQTFQAALGSTRFPVTSASIFLHLPIVLIASQDRLKAPSNSTVNFATASLMSVSSRPHRIPRKPVPSVDSNLLSAFSTSSALNTTFTSAIPPQALPFNLDQPPPSPGSRIPALISCSSPAVGRFPSHLPVPPAPSSSVLAPFSGCLSDDAGKKRPRSSNDNATTSQSRPNAFSLLKGPVKAALAAGKHRDISIQHRAQTRVSLSTPPPCSPSLTTGSNTVSYMPSASSSSLGFDHNFALPPLTFDMDFADRNNSFCSEAAKSVWSDESSISQRTATGRPRLFSYPPVTPSPALTTPPFSEFGLPSTTQLQLSRFLYVISESGIRVKFGDLWQGQKTVVIFIRHFWLAFRCLLNRCCLPDELRS